MQATFNRMQAQYDNQLPPSSYFDEAEVEAVTEEIIEQKGLWWLYERVDSKTWNKIVAVCEDEARERIAQDIEDAEWDLRNRY